MSHDRASAVAIVRGAISRTRDQTTTWRKRTKPCPPTPLPYPCLEGAARASAVDYHPAWRLWFSPAHGPGRWTTNGHAPNAIYTATHLPRVSL